MAQVSYGTITITNISDTENIIIEYAQNQDPFNPPTNDEDWSTERPSWDVGYYIWQRTRIHKKHTDPSTDTIGVAVCLTGEPGQTGRGIELIEISYCNYGDGTPSELYEGWQATIPDYDSKKPNYWIKTAIYYDDNTIAEPIIRKDNGVTEAMVLAYKAKEAAEQTSSQLTEYIDANEANIEALQTRTRYFWYNLEPHEQGVNGWINPDYPVGAYAAAGRTGIKFDYDNSSTYGYNTFLGNNKLALRYNDIDMTTLSTNALTFYTPTKDKYRKWIQGTKGLEITAEGLKLYHPGDDQIADAILDKNGLVLQKGGLKSGTPNSNEFVYLSTDKYGANLTINNVTKSSWREVIGTKFGVDYDGTLYASNAVINGSVTITGGNVYTKEETDQMLENMLELDIKYTWGSDEVICEALVLKNGVDIHDQYLPQQFNWELETQQQIIALSGSVENFYHVDDYSVTIKRARLGYGAAITLSLLDGEDFAPMLTNDTHIILPDDNRLLLKV